MLNVTVTVLSTALLALRTWAWKTRQDVMCLCPTRKRIKHVAIASAGLLFATLSLMIIPAIVSAQSLTVASFNVESGGADSSVIGDQIADIDGIDIWGFSEVHNTRWADEFERAAEEGENANFERFLGTSGGGDRLLIVYDSTRLDLIRVFELDNINVGGNVRAPLVGHFAMRDTDQEFLFMVNHLYRSRPDRRHQQAALLNQWATRQALPIVAVGDYNFDWSVSSGDTDHDVGYDKLTENGVFTWVRPSTLIRTQCSRHNSVLDFVFTAGPARQWQGNSQILLSETSYCPDDDNTSDHRPVIARFELNGTEPDDATKVELLERVDAIQGEIDRLRAFIEGL